MQLVARLTKDIVETYQICNPQFKYSEELNPKRYLTSPSIGVLNDGYDNVNSDLILTVNCALVNLETQRRFAHDSHFYFLMIFSYSQNHVLCTWCCTILVVEKVVGYLSRDICWN